MRNTLLLCLLSSVAGGLVAVGLSNAWFEGRSTAQEKPVGPVRAA